MRLKFVLSRTYCIYIYIYTYIYIYLFIYLHFSSTSSASFNYIKFNKGWTVNFLIPKSFSQRSQQGHQCTFHSFIHRLVYQIISWYTVSFINTADMAQICMVWINTTWCEMCPNFLSVCHKKTHSVLQKIMHIISSHSSLSIQICIHINSSADCMYW